MKAFPMMLLVAAMLVLGGCGEKAAGGKTEAAAAPAQKANYFAQFDQTPEEKFAETKKKAEAGDAAAQFKLGVMYATGDESVRLDGEEGKPWEKYSEGRWQRLQLKAVEWYQKAAAQGHADAQFSLGVSYDNGDGVPKDAAKAVEWYQKAAAQENARAQHNLGVMYAKGEGISKDAAKAVEWYQKAAAQGLAHTQYALGLAYDKGEGVPKNEVKAVEWYQKAAAQGDAQAQTSLGSRYSLGVGVPKDMTKAAEWYQKAAAQGVAYAQSHLGLMYGLGDGVSKNLVLAYAWSNLAAAQGDKLAEKNRNFAESQLTPAQRAEGQRLASNWKKGDILQASSDSSAGSASPAGKPSKQGTGTAFAVSSAGHALTNQHVINGCTEVKVAGREGIAKVITSDSVNDLALLQLPGKTKDIASINPEPGKLRQGEDVIVFGYPLEWALSSGGNLTPGIISALTGLGNNTNQIQITAPIQPGSSGSPVMDKKGDVVGVVSMKLSDSKMAKATGSVGQNVNFAVNGQTVRAFLDANQVPYKTGGGLFSREKSNADIAEEARKWTVLVECWK